MNYAKNILIAMLLIIISCNPEKVKYIMYSANSEEHQNVISYSFEFFNSIIGCEAAEIVFNANDNFLFKENNFISEIAFTKKWEICNSNTPFFSVGCIIGLDKDIVMLTENTFEKSRKCELIYNKILKNYFYDCDYRIIGILHELGHSFGLSHIKNKDDIMNEIGPSYVSIELFDNFRDELIKNTNICKTFFKNQMNY